MLLKRRRTMVLSKTAQPLCSGCGKSEVRRIRLKSVMSDVEPWNWRRRLQGRALEHGLVYVITQNLREGRECIRMLRPGTGKTLEADEVRVIFDFEL